MPVGLLLVAAVSVAVSLPLLGQAITSPSVVWTAVTLDFIVALPLLFFVLIVRPLKWPPILVVPAVVLGFLVSSRLVPMEHSSTLEALKYVAAPLEIGLVSWLFWRAGRAFRASAKNEMDPVFGFEKAALDLVHSSRAARIFACEMAVLHYAFVLRPRKAVPTGYLPIAAHERSGHGGLAFATIAILALEGLAVHAWIARWSPVAAWVLSALTAYTAIWVWADFRAAKHRPTLVGPDAVLFRGGLRWSVEVPRHQIKSVGPKTDVDPKERLNLTFMSEPTVWVELEEPVVARGLYGIERAVRTIGLEPDVPLTLNH